MADNADKASQAPPKQAETDKPLQPTVEDLKLAAISTEEITDYAILHMFNNTIINSKEDMKEFFAILDKYRPELSQRIAKLFSRKIS
jgi:hypothetical protein